MNEERHLARAVAALGDIIAIRTRLEEIERALMFDEDRERRQALVREYHDLWETQERAA